MAKLTDSVLDGVISGAAGRLSDDDLLYFSNIDDSDILIDNKLYDRIVSFFILHRKRESVKKIRKTAICVSIICALLFGAAMSIEAVRVSFWNAVINWYDDYIGIYFRDPESNGAAPKSIEEIMIPSYIPEGWEIKEIISNNNTVIYSIFNDIRHITYCQYIYGGGELWIDKSDLKEVSINSSKGYLSIRENKSTVLTLYDKYIFVLDAPDDIDEALLIKIAESVK